MALAGLIAVAALLIVPMLYLMGRLRARQVHDWDLALTAAQRVEFSREATDLHAYLDTADDIYGLAAQRRHEGQSAEALRLLELGCSTIERGVPRLLDKQREMARVTRALKSMVPVPPLRARDFRLWTLSGLVAVLRVLHPLLVTQAERFRVRAWLLGRGFVMVARQLRRSTDRGAVDRADWRTVDLLRADLRRLGDESLRSLRLVLGSLPQPDSSGEGPVDVHSVP